MPVSAPQRRYFRFLIWAVPVTVVLVLAGRHLLYSAVKSRLEDRVQKATGLSCRIGSITRGSREDYLIRDVNLGPEESPVLSLNRIEVSLQGRSRLRSFRVSDGRVSFKAGKMPRVDLEQISISYHDGRFQAQFRAADLNPLLRKAGGVEVGSGRVYLNLPVDLSAREINSRAKIRLKDFRARGLDGRFEFEAESISTGLHISGTPQKFKVDPGELEPYLGRDFVTGLEELLP